MDHPTTAIAFPLTDQAVYAKFMVSFILMEKPTDFTFMLPEFKGHIASIRNNIVKRALENGIERLIMMDTDQVYAPNTLTRLLGYDLPIVCAKVHRRYPPFDPILYRGVEGQYKSVPDEEWLQGGLVEVDATGTGCMCIDMEVFENIPYPWFEEKFIDTPKGQRLVGEDINFCGKAKAAGYRIFVDTGIDISHISLLEVDANMYRFFKAIEQHKQRRNAATEDSNGESRRQ